MVIGFQEIVPLTAQQIVQTDPEKKYCCLSVLCRLLHLSVADRRLWENKILETLERRPNKKCDYILLRSEQVLDNTEFRAASSQHCFLASRHCIDHSRKI
jgi:hypothetical protein